MHRCLHTCLIFLIRISISYHSRELCIPQIFTIYPQTNSIVFIILSTIKRTKLISLAQLLLMLANFRISFILQHQGDREMRLGLPDGRDVGDYNGSGFVEIS